MIVIGRAFESSDTILIDQKKLSHVRTHPEELRAVKSEFYSKNYINLTAFFTFHGS